MSEIETSVLRIGSNDLILQDAAARGSLADAYNASSTYAVGDIVLKDGQLYECNTAISTAEAWTAAHWTAVTVGEKVADLEADTNQLKEDISQVIDSAYVTDTASGAIASFPDGADGVPVKSLTVDIEPVQSGSGDPSPTNIRPITGHTSAVVTVSPTTDAQDGTSYTIDLDGTRYGGSLDVGTGVLTVDRKYRLLNGVDGDGVTFRNNGQTSNTTRAFVTVSDKAYGQNNMISSSFHYVAGTDIVGNMVGRSGNSGIEFYLATSVPDTESGVKAWFADNPTDIVYELATPFTVQLTAQEITTLKGQNNIWNDCGDTEVEYRADTKLYIQKVINS